MDASFSFPTQRRLKGRENFVRIQRSRRGIKTDSFIVRYEFTQEQSARFGLTVSKRVGNAVARNRIKRLLREAIRTNDLHEMGVDVVFIAKAISKDASFSVVNQEVRTALKTIGLLP